MKTEIGKMDKKDYVVIGGIALVSLTGVILIAIQIKKLGDRKKLLAAQVNSNVLKFDGTDVNCLGCDGSQNCSGCTKYSNVTGLLKNTFNKTGKQFSNQSNACENAGGWWWNGKCNPSII